MEMILSGLCGGGGDIVRWWSCSDFNFGTCIAGRYHAVRYEFSSEVTLPSSSISSCLAVGTFTIYGLRNQLLMVLELPTCIFSLFKLCSLAQSLSMAPPKCQFVALLSNPIFFPSLATVPLRRVDSSLRLRDAAIKVTSKP